MIARPLILVTLALATTAAAQVVTPLEPDEHTLLLYSFEGDGDQIIDRGPFGLHAELVVGEDHNPASPVRVPGIAGQALSLANHQAIVPATVPDALRGMDQITVEAWFRSTNEDPTHRQRIIAYWNHYLLSIFEGGSPRSHLYGPDARMYALSARQTVIPGQWYHMAETWDGERVRLWINGRVVNSMPMDEPMVNPEPGANFHIGAVGGDSFIGQIDELRISSIARESFPRALQHDFCHPASTLAISPGTARMIFNPIVPADVESVTCTAAISTGPSAHTTLSGLEPLAGFDMLTGTAEVVVALPEGVSGERTFSGTVTYSSGGEEVTASREFDLTVRPMVPVPEEEFRAAWTHSHRIEDPEDIFSRMAAAGLNAAIMRVRRGETAYYASDLGPISNVPFDNENLIEDCIAACERHGIDLHCYVNNFPIGSPDSEYARQLRAEGRWQKTAAGEDWPWLCPSQEANLQLVEDAMVELVEDYDIAGVQYDFIRYGRDDVCFCEHCRANFEQRIGRRVENWPEDCLEGGPLYDEWMDERANLITEAVRRTSAAVRAADPDAMITAAVFALPPEQAKLTVGQDWARWCEEGLLDALCPMSYTGDDADYEQTVRTIVEAVGEYVPVYAGIGIRASRTVMRYPEELAPKLNILREVGARGFAMFCITPTTDAPETLLLPLRSTLLRGDGRPD